MIRRCLLTQVMSLDEISKRWLAHQNGPSRDYHLYKMKKLIAISCALVAMASAQQPGCGTTTTSSLLASLSGVYLTNLCNGEPCVYPTNCYGLQCKNAPTDAQISNYFTNPSAGLTPGTCGDYMDEAAAAVGMAIGLVIFLWVLGLVCVCGGIGLCIYCCVRANRQKLQVQLI